MATSSTKTAPINIRGRVMYLEAIGAYWPELLSSLPWQTWRGTSPNARPETFSEMANVPDYEQNCDALEKWAAKYGIRDRWIWDAAVQTLMNSPTGTIPMAWLYRSPEYPTEPFSLTVGHWIPDLFPWSEFKQAATRKFAQELEGYRRSRIRIWGSNRTSVARQAKWTVLWQRGKTVTQIRSHYPKLHTRDVSPDGVLMGIRSFASSIGVTLREGSSGPRRRT